MSTPHNPNQQGIWRLKRWTDKPNNQAYLELGLTFIAIIFFSWFALRLTFVTISELYAEMKSLEVTVEKLDDKIESIAAMQLLYQQVADQLPLIDQAMPEEPNLTEFIGQVEVIAEEVGLQVDQITYNEIYLNRELQLKQQKTNARRQRINDDNIKWIKLDTMVSAKGNYQSIKEFILALNKLRRLYIIDNLTITLDPEKDSSLRTVRITGYIGYY